MLVNAGAVADTLASQVAGVTALWVILMSALRLMVAGMAGLRPMIVAIARSLYRQVESGSPGGWRMTNALNSIQVTFLARVMTAWDVLLLFGGLGMLGLGLALGTWIDAVKLLEQLDGNSVLAWNRTDLRFDMAAAVFIVAGSTMFTAALSARRIVSFVTSTLFTAAGLGIGLVLALGVSA